MKRSALLAGLKLKAREGDLFLVDELRSEDGKTKGLARWVETRSLHKPLVIMGDYDRKTYLAARNLGHLKLTTARETSVYDVLKAKECVLTKQGYQNLLERLKS